MLLYQNVSKLCEKNGYFPPFSAFGEDNFGYHMCIFILKSDTLGQSLFDVQFVVQIIMGWELYLGGPTLPYS